jgi:Cu-Zn family superoxide dismutase
MRLAVAVLVLAVPAAAGGASVTKAVAVLQPTQGSVVKGSVSFFRAAGGMRVVARIEGLAPGLHGFHIHEFGDCSAPDGASAGAHFNPGGAPHAGPHDATRHAGDMGNVEADAKGIGVVDYVDSKASFEGESSILGRGVIVHANADDLKTQPTGNAGGRLACGVIGAVKAE